MGIMAGVGGLVGGLSGLFGGGGANSIQLPQMFQMPNMGASAGNAFGGIENLQGFTNTAQGTLGQAGQTFGNLYNNPYAGGFQQGAGVAGALGQNQALGQYGVGNSLTGMGFGLGSTMGGIGNQMVGMVNPLMSNAQTVMNTAMDPQSQLYSYLQNQNTQQSNANNMAAGLGTSPYGVGLTNQSNQLFNMNWENQQLGRQLSGLQGYTSAAGQGGQLLQGGGNLMGAGGQLAGGLASMGQQMSAAAPGQYLGASGTPYSTYAGIGQGQNQALQSYLGNISGAAGPQQQQIGDYLSYLGVGNQANSIANQNAALQLQQQQQNFNQQMTLGGMLGGSLYGLGKAGFPGFQNNFGSGGSFFPGSSLSSGNVFGSFI